MIIRGQDLDFAKKRLAFDLTSFNRKKMPPIDYEIDNESVSIEDASDKIYQLYQKHLKKKNI